jgi:hypothetical protein
MNPLTDAESTNFNRCTKMLLVWLSIFPFLNNSGVIKQKPAFQQVLVGKNPHFRTKSVGQVERLW